LNAANLSVSNSLAEDGISSLVAGYGYPSARLAEGGDVYEAALAAVNKQTAADGAQQSATLERREAEAAARDAYKSLAKVARAVFSKDKARLAALGLSGLEPKASAEFIAAASALFENAAAAPDLPDYGYDIARLEADRARLAAFILADQKQQAAMGAAQQATQERDAALARMDAWHAQYIKIARVALRNQPQLLEKLGVPARTSKTAAQKAAGRRKAGEG
jgi:hypothetical protein